MNGLKTDTIINRDTLYALRELPEESVHCCVTSPPYYALRDYGLDMQIGREDTPEQYIDRLTEVFRELRRVLRSDGTLWLNIADTYCGTGNNGNCILLDDGDECVCPQLISYSLLCKWFRVAVLPADRLLYAELYQTGDKKKCTECGAFFASTSNSVKYCPVCRNASAACPLSAAISSIRLTKSAYCSILCSVKKFMVFAACFRLWIFAHCS